MVRITVGRASAFLLALLLTGGVAAISANAAPKAGAVTFGDKPTFQSDSNFVFDLSADKEAFTISFNPAFEASAGNNVGDPPIGTRAFSVAIPVNGQHHRHGPGAGAEAGGGEGEEVGGASYR